MLKEFREFAVKGNVVDLAVGIILGAAFTTIVRSLVDDIIMPIVGALIGGVDFADLFITLSEGEYASLAQAQEAGAATVNYGLFINAVLIFLIVAWILFFIIRFINRIRQQMEPKEEEAPAAVPEAPADVQLLTEIRDLLKAGRPSA